MNRLGLLPALLPQWLYWGVFCSAALQSQLLSAGHRECMEILLAHEVDIDQEDLQHGTPLYVACTYQRTDCVKKLLELGIPRKGAKGQP